VVRLELQAREIPKLLIARAQAVCTSPSLPLHPVIITLKGILQVNILTQLGVLAAAAGLGWQGDGGGEGVRQGSKWDRWENNRQAAGSQACGEQVMARCRMHHTVRF
jgi:hypothetical protein